MLLAPRCPRCRKGPLFASLLKVHAACPACGLVLEKHDAGDGPAFFAIVIVGFMVMTAAGIVEYHFAPPLWVHALLWIPAVFGGAIFCLRLFKTYLIALEYRVHRLDDGRKD